MFPLLIDVQFTQNVGRSVCVYKYLCTDFRWVFVGKHRAHYKEITSLIFLPAKNPNGDFKLVSTGLDRCLVEYDVAASYDEHLEILSLDRVEQSALPLSAIVWPAPSYLDPEEFRTDLPMILIANDEVLCFLYIHRSLPKLSLYDIVQFSTSPTRRNNFNSS